MKKVVSLILTLVMVASMAITAFAGPGWFVDSPSGNLAPKMVRFMNGSNDCKAELIIKAYTDRNTLPNDLKVKLEKAYNDIKTTANLSKLCADLSAVAKAANVPVTSLAVSDLFDIHYENCDIHNQHGAFTITLEVDTLDNFAALIHLNGDVWENVENVKVEGKQITFTVDSLSPFAIVVNGSDMGFVPPPTGDDYMIALYAGIMVISAGALVIVLTKAKKRAAK